MKNLILALLMAGVSLPAQGADDPLALADEAVRRNPGLEALLARAQGLSALANAAGTWTDPRIGIEYLNAPVDSFRLDRSPMSGLEFRLEQKLPEWGWARASKEAAELRAEAGRHAAAEAQVQLRRDVEILYWRLALSELLEEVTRSHLDRTRELLDVVRVHYEVGRVGQNAVLRLGVLRDRLNDDLSDFDRVDRELSAGLNGALARPAASRFETPPHATPLPVDGTAAGWLELARAHRPELLRLREEASASQKEAEVARISTRPDVNVWMKYRLRTIDTTLDDGTDFVSLGLSVPIPWGSRKKGLGAQAERLESERSSRAWHAAAIDRIESELHTIEASWSRAFGKAITYREQLIPAARATLETTLSDFSVGKADFSSLYESEVELLLLEKTYLVAAVETRIQSAAARGIAGVSSLGASR